MFADTDAVKSVSVMEGDSVSLNSRLTGTQKHDLITWKFGYPETRIAIINREEGIVSTSEGDAVGFRDRLKLDHQTGSLTITDTRTTDSGLYTVIIKGAHNDTTYRFNVTVSGESQLHMCLFCLYNKFTFTFMHLADAFIQSNLHCIQVTVSTFYQLLHFISSCFPWESNP